MAPFSALWWEEYISPRISSHSEAQATQVVLCIFTPCTLRFKWRKTTVFNASQHVNGETSNPGFEALAVMPLNEHWIRQVTGCCTKPIGWNRFSMAFGRALESHGEAVNIEDAVR